MRNVALSCLVFVALLGCDRKPGMSPPAQNAQKPFALDDAFIDTIVPLANGDAYAIGLPGDGVWLLRGAEAVRIHVKEVPAFSPDNKPARIMRTATNPQTGERIGFDANSGKWTQLDRTAYTPTQAAPNQ